LGEIDRAAGIPGAIGAIMRREGLYSSKITDWRRQIFGIDRHLKTKGYSFKYASQTARR
jgi:hypothetical protein